jgi:hypothetical protein
MFFEKPHIEKQDFFRSCVLQILCVEIGVEQNYSETSYSEVKFPAVSFKIKDDLTTPSSPTKPKMEHFYQKKEFKKPDISQNVHLGFSSNFTKINFNIWSTRSISKIRGILLRFKMAADLKMAVENWFFDHNSVNIKYFYGLSFAICKSSYNTNFIEIVFYLVQNGVEN